MNNWQGILNNEDQEPLQATSLPVGNGIFTFLKLRINDEIAYKGIEESEAQTIAVRCYTA